MANTVQAGIVIDGVIDGTTVGYQIMVVYGEIKPLEQWYNEETGACSPDWAAAWVTVQQSATADNLAKLPRLYIRARDLSTGADLTKTVTITQVLYNGTPANWDAGNTAHNGLIRMADASSPAYGYTYDNKVVPTVMIIDNPADALTNPDNDRISFSGTVVTDGGQVHFNDLGKDIDIHPELSANAGYSLQLIVPDDKESYIYDKQVSTKRIAVLYHDGNQVDPAAVPHIFEFEDVTGVTDVPLTAGANIVYTTTAVGGKQVTNNTIEIKPDAVNSMMTMRCNCYSYDNNVKGDRIASALAVIYDTSDEFQVKWEIAENSNFTSILESVSNQNLSEGPRFTLRKGQTRYLRPKIVKGSGGDEVAATNGWRFNADDPNADAAVTDMDDTRINNSTAGQTYCYIKYTDVVKSINGTPTRRPVVIHAQTTL